MKPRYRFEPSQSRFTVQAFVAGLLAFAGHSPTFLVRDFHGSLSAGKIRAETLALELTAHTSSLELVNRVREADRREIEERMRRDVLETAAIGTAAFRSDRIAAQVFADGRYRLDIEGQLSLHGVTNPYRLGADLFIADDRLRLQGTDRLAMSDFRIKPVTALGGTIRLKDEVALSFALVALPEAS